MKKLESSLTNMVLVLTGVAVIMGAILAWMNSVTTDPIAQQKKKALDDGIKAVMQTETVNISKTDTLRQINAKGKEQIFIIYNNEKGAAVESTTDGFGGKLRVLVGFDHEGKILGYTLLEHAETPGLGAKADKWFQADSKGSIIGKKPTKDSLLTVTKETPKNEYEVQAITASTITSKAFILAVNNAYKAYKEEPATDAQTSATKQHK
ncbi:RnfABCDGE type electron transport complex subunit G [Prevotella sp. E2-28]|uniref:RnfABCDGE type electron transport complex subunit G n=1 Tax=Prevotella sp. E2-28 TaxID=2913620 RepID=UPI001EDA7FFE|nr:RnfABCDGE type electron transport complex subunit G [Prevotella sp. E2-28]UKK54718.1 RnfABCDGE type electron transport complex subunit G [Prevotella sp. E2-28]